MQEPNYEQFARKINASKYNGKTAIFEFYNILLNSIIILFYLAGRLIDVIIPKRELYRLYQKDKRMLWLRTAEAARICIHLSHFDLYLATRFKSLNLYCWILQDVMQS